MQPHECQNLGPIRCSPRRFASDLIASGLDEGATSKLCASSYVISAIRTACNRPPALVNAFIGLWVFQGAKACRSRSRALDRRSKCLVKLGNLVPDPVAIDVRLERLP